MDMSKTIAPKSDQINADDLISGPRTITITRVSGNEGNADQPVNVFFESDGGKPFRPCKQMRRVMVAIWGADAAQYVGRSMTLYRDPAVQFGGMQVGGIRISAMSGIDKPQTMALTVTRASRKPYTVQPLQEAPKADAAALEAARAAARRGTTAFRAAWPTMPADVKAAAKPIMAELQKIAADAEAERDADPFGLPQIPESQAPQRDIPEAAADLIDRMREATTADALARTVNGADFIAIRDALPDDAAAAVFAAYIAHFDAISGDAA